MTFASRFLDRERLEAQEDQVTYDAYEWALHVLCLSTGPEGDHEVICSSHRKRLDVGVLERLAHNARIGSDAIEGRVAEAIDTHLGYNRQA